MITTKKLIGALVLGLTASVAQAAAADPAADRAARELLIAMDQRGVIIATLQEIERSLPAEKDSKGSTEIAASIKKMAADPVFMEQMIAETVPIYTQRFSTAELKKLTAFYSSPLGQRFVSTAPEVRAAVVQVNRKVIGAYLQRRP